MCNSMSQGASWVFRALAVTLAWGAVACGGDIIWDFENGNDHGFELTCVNPATPAADNPAVAGDEAITGVGGPKGLPGAGIAWCIGRPDQFDGMKPAVQEGDKTGADGTMQYNRAGTNHPFAFPRNGRGQESYLNTYNLTGWGDNVHTAANDQIAKSPLVLLGQGAVLTVWAQGGGSGTHAPALDANPAAGYTAGSSGIAVLSAADGSLLSSVLTNGQGTLRQDTLNLSAYAGQKVRIEVVDAFDGGWGWLAVDEIRITNAVSLGAAPKATAPNPADGAKDVPFDVTLSWAASEFAGTHDVYFGKTFADVNEAGRTAPKDVLVSQGQTAVTYDPAALLEYGQTYYWRVDEVNKAPDQAIYQGEVWSFTVEPVAYPVTSLTVKASSQQGASLAIKTIDGSGLNAEDQHSNDINHMWMSTGVPAWLQYTFDQEYQLDKLWVWNANSQLEGYMKFGVKAVKIEYSLDGTAWTELAAVPEFAPGPGTPAYTANTIVQFGGVSAKHVRLTIDATWGNPMSASLSEVRFFYVPLQARVPQPADGAKGVGTEVSLNWRPGREASSHQVYFGPDQAAVAGGTTGANTGADHSFSPSGLILGTTYYWRVDEVGTATYAGEVWSFTTEEFKVVDDFESYTDKEGAEVFSTWIDGLADNYKSSGSTVGLATAESGTFCETTILHGGRLSMPFAYDNTTLPLSEATRTFTLAQDWTANGIKSLSLWFYGDPANAGQLYVKVNNTKVLYNGGAPDLKRKQWQPWNIDLSAVGAGLNKVTKLTIGVEGAGAKGQLYLDDIRLYPRTPELLTPVDPGKTGLLAEYLFDNGANDSSGKGHHGTFLGNARVADRFLLLDGVDDAVAIPRLGGADATFTRCTYSMWMNSVRDPATAGIIGGINSNNWTTGGIHCKLFDGRANAGVYALAGGDMNGKTSVGPDEWVHLALTVSDTEAAIYLNGQREDSRSFSTPLGMYLGNGCIGAWNNNNDIQRELTGKMDDVRIYDRAVSEAELLWLAGRRTPVNRPF